MKSILDFQSKKLRVYLDNASTTYPKPESVYNAMDKFIREFGVSPGRGGYKCAARVTHIVTKTRKKITELFNGDNPKRVIFTLNATDALNIAIKGILSKGDHVVTTHLEHNSVSRPLMGLEKLNIISLARVDNSSDGFIDPDDIKRALNKNTKLVVVTHASNVLGTIQPITEIGKAIKEINHSIFFLVDCAQTAGVLPIDIKEACIDLLAFPGHKALLGPPGTGGLYVGKGIKLRPWREGGTGTDSISPTQPTLMPFWLEAGTPNTVGIVGLNEGINFITEKGTSAIWKHEVELLDYLINQLEGDNRFKIYGSRDAQKHIGCISVNIKGKMSNEVGLKLDQIAHIAVRTGLHCAPYIHKKIGSFPDGTVRISPGFFNTIQDIDTAVEVLRQIAECKSRL